MRGNCKLGRVCAEDQGEVSEKLEVGSCRLRPETRESELAGSSVGQLDGAE